MAHFKIPLDLPHAGTISMRIAHCLSSQVEAPSPEYRHLASITRGLQDLLIPFRNLGCNPPKPEAEQTTLDAARLGRELVSELERLHLGGDRLGQCVRNHFECLELGEEGAALGLRAGENPLSLLRPK
jgi:hypothetical protein